MNRPPAFLRIIDSHTGGEPTRLIVEGFPDLGPGTMAQLRERFAERFDHLRQAAVLEPRGSDVLVGALLCRPANPAATAGVIFFNNSGFLGMCGHGTIGLIASLAWLGRIEAGQHLIETPVGDVRATLNEDGSVSVENVPAWRWRRGVRVATRYGDISGDIAWGGNWFFLVNDHPLRIDTASLTALTDFAIAIRQGLEQARIRGADGGIIDHIELFGPDARADSRSFVLCPGLAWDRSPCGTGTSAKLACLAEDGLLAPGQVWRQTSVIGSEFSASYRRHDRQIIPTIHGSAWVCADTRLLFDERDPFRWGIAL
ncbi:MULTISPECIES: 4-hydroxyproline epimerase [Tenebrionibacter/Tenebrionicola group]|jgi:4-hydroxyproline epimerase|uniref:4-hydroxyproline epimerase n=2 Tax=Tenebrionibacter/Tenebrionicola group TaxID=2969848 RepID=A0A8K0V681_9ENTR|nr:MULTISPECIES: 4-hydroxyproline epimerase [Tenebrionibacter/Tenebrionicola group]MBK4714895.1 4-hydroxyproline epimerase [Tenebrionibacter intestinalis]MBV5095721.1 4-hydroxyproline epimerase [Tenebrionicola larvae]